MRLTTPRHAEILPRAMTITAAPRAQALAAALCALPRMPRGLRCPAALGGALRLEFTAEGAPLPAGSHPGLGLRRASPGWAQSASGPGHRGPDGC